ncbi:MAG: type I-E CRISPR-associated protein Cse2/CasB [Methylothermaceae bacterium]|nr:type I-E CRISPR-associated protein Cse2/CasB [Methylothermaceae bacterium]
MSKLFDPNQPAGQILQDWWLELIENRGERAELRRAKSVIDAALQPVTIRLITRLQSTPTDNQQRLAMIAGLSSHLDPHSEQTILRDPKPLPEKMTTSKGERVLVSELRFRRLLRYQSTEELYRPMIRVLALLDHRANLFDLAESMYWWGDRVRKDWAFAYFPNLPHQKTI